MWTKDAFVIKVNIANKELNRILIHLESSVDILFKSTLDEMRIADVKLKHTNTSLKGFRRRRLTPLEIKELLVTIGSRPFKKGMMLDLWLLNNVALTR